MDSLSLEMAISMGFNGGLGQIQGPEWAYNGHFPWDRVGNGRNRQKNGPEMPL